MAIIYSEEELQCYLEENTIDESSYPLLMDSYVEGIEVEVDLISDGKDILIPGLMEHIEPTGVHSGDSFAVYPQRRLSKKNVKELVSYSGQIASALKVVGLLNIQYVVSGDEIYVIEVNPRASRTVPILSKVTKVPMIQVGLQVMLGEKLKDLHYGTGLLPELSLVAVKAPVFSFHKLKKVDVTLGPEMKSTGEVLGVDDTYEGALCKAFLASGHDLLKDEDAILLSMNHDVIQEHIDLFKSLPKFSIKLYATEGTYKRLRSFGIAATLFKENESDGLLQELKDKKIKVMVNIPSKTWKRSESSQNLREAAIQQKIPCFTCMDTFSAYLEATVYLRKTVSLEYKTMEEYLRTYHTVSSLSSFRHKDCV